MAPKNPPNHIYQGATEAGFNCKTDEVFIPMFNTSKQTSPTTKLRKDAIKGPPVCFPNLVLRIACIGSNPPITSVRNINRYFIEQKLTVSEFVKLHKTM